MATNLLKNVAVIDAFVTDCFEGLMNTAGCPL